MEIVLSGEKIAFQYPSHQVLKGVNLEVNQGDFLGIIGPNGSGKSTLMKLLSGVLAPNGGCIYLDQMELSSIKRREVAQQVAVVPQETGADFNFSVEEVVMMGRAPYLGRFASAGEKDMKIVSKTLEMTGCSHLRNRMLFELSGGERQRVILARALAQEPRVLLLDEPTSHLDINYQTEVLNVVKGLNETGLTVIAVMHDLNLAAQYTQKLVMLKDGIIQAAGTPWEVITSENVHSTYKTKVLISTHPLLGVPQVALVPGQKKQKDKIAHVIGGGGTAASIFRTLLQAGYDITTGVLNAGDSDWETARFLSLAIVEAPPFSPIGKAEMAAAQGMINKADLVILSAIPFGSGNLTSLELALHAVQKGTPVLMHDIPPVEDRDYTEGVASAIWNQIKQAGAVAFTSVDQLESKINEICINNK